MQELVILYGLCAVLVAAGLAAVVLAYYVLRQRDDARRMLAAVRTQMSYVLDLASGGTMAGSGYDLSTMLRAVSERQHRDFADGRKQGIIQVAAACGLSAAERKVVLAMGHERSIRFADIAAETGLSLRRVAQIVRNLHGEGLAEFGPLFTDDCAQRLAGRGYWLTPRGLIAQRAAWQLEEATA